MNRVALLLSGGALALTGCQAPPQSGPVDSPPRTEAAIPGAAPLSLTTTNGDWGLRLMLSPTRPLTASIVEPFQGKRREFLRRNAFPILTINDRALTQLLPLDRPEELKPWQAGRIRGITAQVADAKVSVGIGLHPRRRQGAVEIKITATAPIKVSVVNLVHAGESQAERPPLRQQRYRFSGEGVDQNLAAGESLTVWATLGDDPKSPANLDPEPLVAELRRTPLPGGPRFKLIGPAEDAAALEALTNKLQESLNIPQPALDPFGGTAARYNGHIFWDADRWVFPAAMFLAPRGAKALADFRVMTRESAQYTYYAWQQTSFPVAGGVRHDPDPAFFALAEHKALMFPWEAAPDGTERSPTETVFQHHVGASVALMADDAAAWGLMKPADRDLIVDGVARFALVRSTLRKDGRLTIRRTISPSEWHTADDDLYTNAAFDVVLRRSQHQGRGRFYLPRDETTYLTFTGDDLTAYQQAAALLAVFPLRHPEVVKEAEAMLKRFEGKAAPAGPAMSLSIEATIAAQLGHPDALERWRNSWRTYANPPALMFRERPRHGEGTFITGVASCLNTVLYGFLGLRIERRVPAPDEWYVQLDDGAILTARPQLPPEWKELRLENVQIGGKSFTLIFRGRTLTSTPRRP